jgi:hypothetical protein
MQSAEEIVCDGNAHLMPDDDHIIHIECATCICGPKLELLLAEGMQNPVLLYMHNALSGDSIND